ncbi:MAG: hypothetical protein ACLU38_15880 [Dysosmobacter sp.]
MFTPQEVSEKVFPKASGFSSGGYSMSCRGRVSGRADGGLQRPV